MPRKPSLKQKEFVKEYLRNGEHGTKAALKVYNTKDPASASVIAVHTLQSEAVQTYMQSILSRVGLTDEQSALHLQKIIEAGLTKRAIKKATPSDSLRGLEMRFKLADQFPSQRVQIDKREVKMQLSGKSTEELMNKLQDVNKEIERFKRMVKKSEKTVNIVSSN
jgi:phage terminase small subunit